MRQEERVSYVMLFCALMMMKRSQATLEQSMAIVPLSGGAKHLAGEMMRRLSEPQPPMGSS